MKSNYTTFSICVILLFTLFTNSESVFAQSPPPSGWLYTNGNRIYISDGDGNKANDEVFAGRGANIFDTRSCGAGVSSAPNVDEIKRRIDLLVDDWGANFMRLCLESRGEPYQSYWVNYLPFTKDNTGYLEDIVEIVDYIGTKPGVYVEVSLWWEPSTTSGGLPTEDTNEEWRILAPALAKYKHVLFGICNEPHINNDPEVHAAMESAAAAIREEEAKTSYPQHVIAVQGTRQYARDIKYYLDHPVSGGVNIVYETHPYSNDFGQWFFNEQKTIPVLIGEFGPAVINNRLYQTLEESQNLMDTCDYLKIPYAGWSFHMRCDPNMLVDNSNKGLGVGMKLEPTEWGKLFRDNLQGMRVGTKIRNIKVESELNFNDVDNSVLISAMVYSVNDQITSVTADLSEIGGGSNVVMTKNGVVYSCSHLIPAGFPAGKKYVTITAKNSKDINTSAKGRVLVKEPIVSEMVIYRDNETKITEEEVGWGRGTLSEVSGGAPEGNKQYKWDYLIKDWWGGFQLFLNNRQGVDFTGYKAIRFACRKDIKTGNPDELDMIFKLADTEGHETEILKLKVMEDLEYYTIPLSDMKNVDLTIIEKLIFDGNPFNNKEYTGEFYLDDITLIPLNTGNLSVSPLSLTLEPTQGSQGNVSITTNNNWTASTTAGWLSLSATSGSGNGSITVTTNSVNASTSNRTGSVTISSGGSSKIIVVTQKWEDPLAVDPVSDKLVHMYPNPAGDKMRIEVPEMANVRIMNMQGASLITKRNILSSDIDISGLPKGIYLVKVEIGDKVSVRRLVKY